MIELIAETGSHGVLRDGRWAGPAPHAVEGRHSSADQQIKYPAYTAHRAVMNIPNKYTTVQSADRVIAFCEVAIYWARAQDVPAVWGR